MAAYSNEGRFDENTSSRMKRRTHIVNL